MEIDENDFKQLIGLLQQLVSNQNPTKKKNKSKSAPVDEVEEDEDDEITQETTSVIKDKKSRSVVKKTKFVNKFLDMKEANMHKADSAIDKKLNQHPPMQRDRAYEPVEVKCRVCGKKDMVPPSLIESRDRYKCNNCATSQG